MNTNLSMNKNHRRIMGISAVLAVVGMSVAAGAAPAGEPPVIPPDLVPTSPSEKPSSVTVKSDAPKLEPYTETISGTVLTIDMVPIPPGSITMADPADPTKTAAKEIGALYVSTVEISWDHYNAFLFGLDKPEGAVGTTAADAVTKPTKPYVAADRGFGTTGYPVISVSYRGAESFAAWLAAKTGKKYRLPTEAEWEYACRAGASTKYPSGDDAASLDSISWFADNAEAKTHLLGTKEPNTWGLYDMLGNAGEWAKGIDNKWVIKGGSFVADAAAMRPEARLVNTGALNASDPNIPKSKWWLTEGGFVGFRVVCEPDTGAKAAGN
ncbi:MAG: formylglycine-generating enzyme family protein [Phycisphaerae bacterium]|nr:formylglycine-generating enzyme family protein [Phycisphaerae bacterium]